MEIQRFSKPEEWKYVQACDVIADLGTRPVKDLKLVSQESEWINGYSWIKRKQSDFPTKSIKEIKLTQNDIIELQKESPIKFKSQEKEVFNDLDESSFVTYKTSMNQTTEIKKCYQFSNYVIDPNKHRYKTIIRILALVIKFVNILKSSRGNKLRCSKRLDQATNSKKNSQHLMITEKELQEAKNYMFKKATSEVKQFVKPSLKIESDKRYTLLFWKDLANRKHRISRW